jgi:iron uptake system EfeUOB component EfeO/EfeM
VLKRWVRGAVLVLAVLAAGLIGAAPGASSLPISTGGCPAPPPSVAAGPISLTVTNRAALFAAVYLINPAGAVFAEIPSLTPGKSLPLATTLGAGTYRLRCVFTDNTVRDSAAFTVTGTTSGAVTGYRAVPDLALAGPVGAYRNWVRAALPGLLAASQTLAADVAAGDLAKARADWLTAHLDYERLGAAYNSFGDFDDAINGRADGLPKGTADPDWTGFHAIEYALWHGGSATQLAALTGKLVNSVNGLIADFPSEEVDPGDLPLRAHEILENAMQFQLTGLADYGSATTLATTYANTQGTEEVVSVLAALITPRDPGLLPTITSGLARVQADLLAARSATGVWTAPANLPLAQRQRLDGDLGELLEHLSVLPDLLAPRTFG